MKLNKDTFVNITEAVALKDSTTYEDTVALAHYCREYGFYICFGLNCFTPDLIRLLDGYKTKVGAPVGGSSIGCELETVKLFDIQRFLEMGCDETDIIMNIPFLRAGRYELVLQELKKARDLVRKQNLKVIIQSAILTEEEIRVASELVMDSGADFIKTNTGFLGPTTISQVKTIKDTVGDKIRIKAAGGIEGIPMVRELLELGVSRLGLSVSKAVAIADELDQISE